jgi:hypothetical protein
VSNNICSAIVIDRWPRNPSGEKITVELDGKFLRLRAASMEFVVHLSHLPRIAESLTAALTEAKLLGLIDLPEARP